MTSKKPLIFLTAGGTGGHVYPAEALAEELVKRGYSLALITDKRGKDNYKGKLGEITNFSVFSGALVGKSKWFKIKSLFKTLLGTFQSCFLLLKYKPLCVIGFGGYASFPCSLAAIILRKKLIIHEQNSVMSRTNRVLSKRASLIAQSFKNVKFTPKGVKSVLTGMPIRQSIIDIKDRKYNLDGKFQIAVLGGSQGAKIFGEIVPQTIKKFDTQIQKNFVIYQQCREQDKKDVEKAYADIKSEVIISHFFNNMPEIYKKTNLIISRTGASSIYEILAVGIPSILIPLPTSADDHQTSNAKEIADAGAGIVLKQKDFNVENLYNIINNMINNKKDLADMAKKAKTLGITDAAKRFADTIEKTIV